MFDKYEKGVGREGLIEYPYLLVLMEIWPGYWKNQVKRTSMKMDE